MPKSKKPAAKKLVKTKKAPQSFRVQPETEPFLSINIGLQTLYWFIFSAVVLVACSILIHIHIGLVSTYDSIDYNDAMSQIEPQVQAKSVPPAAE